MTTPARHVIGIGETILDIIFKDGQVRSAVPGGSTFNAMISLGRCRVPAMLVSEVGADNAGEYILNFMRANNVATDYMLSAREGQTPLSLAFLDANNDATYSFYTSPFTPAERCLPEIEADDILLFGSYYAIDRRRRASVKSLLDYARAQGALIVYDVNFRAAHRGEVARLMPNIIENLVAADIVRGSSDDFSIIYNKSSAAAVYREEVACYCPNFIYTAGAAPVEAFGEGALALGYPTPAVPTVSTIGAGDSFNAGLIYALLRNDIRRQQLAAGLTAAQWERLITTAQRFAANCCGSMCNYISADFAQKGC